MTQGRNGLIVVLVGALAVAGASRVPADERSPAPSPLEDSAQKAQFAHSIIGYREAATKGVLSPREQERLFRALTARPLAVLQEWAADPARAFEPEALGDAGEQLLYTPIAPCRIIDTRVAGGPLTAGATRDFKVVGGGHQSQGGSLAGCGVPSGPTSALLNLVGVDSAGSGNLRAWAYSTPPIGPPAASVLNFSPGLAIANGVPVPICNPAVTTCPFDFRVFAGGSSTQVVVDVVGYFEQFPDTPGASTESSAAQAIPDGVETRIVFNTEKYDTDGMVNLGVDNGRFTINTTGTYLLAGAISWTANATGRRSIFFKVNVTQYRGFQTDVPAPLDTLWQNLSFVTRLSAGDFVELYGFQTSGGPLNSFPYPGIAPTLSVQWLGP